MGRESFITRMGKAPREHCRSAPFTAVESPSPGVTTLQKGLPAPARRQILERGTRVTKGE
jgi:hypothetical protein